MMKSDIHIFNQDLLQTRWQRTRDNFDQYDFLFQNVGNKLFDRLFDVQRQFENVLIIGSKNIPKNLEQKIKKQTVVDVLALKEEVLPFKDNEFDLVISNLCLHWINDLPGFLIQIKNILKPDGLFLSSLFGGDTLFELRTSLMNTEIEIMGGASPRVSPFLDIKDAGALLQRAGFNLPVADKETITVTYPNTLKLMKDLRGMGETNALSKQNKKIPPKNFFPALEVHYQQKFAESNGRLPVSFEVIYMSGWKNHESQQKPLKPGSAEIHLSTVLKG